MRTHNWIARLVVLAGTLALGLASAQPTPPPQPTTGPGGSTYSNSAVTVNGPYYANNRTSYKQLMYYIYEPAGPVPASAPVILFMHGFAAFTPDHYVAWINHMVRNGNIVVWVAWEATVFDLPTTFAPNARAAWADSLYRLQHFWWEKHVPVMTDQSGQPVTMMVGHSAGGWLSAVMAATAHSVTPYLPYPKSLVLFEPGGKGLIPGADFSKIPASTSLVEFLGDQDTLVCSGDALKLYTQTPQVTQKQFLWVQSDTHGAPQQLGNHFYPNTDGYNDTTAIDNRDFSISWKFSVASATCAFSGQNCSLVFGNGSSDQTNMGSWSDNVPILPLVYYADPTTIPKITGCK